MKCWCRHYRPGLEASHTEECPAVAAVVFALSRFVPQLAAGYSLEMAAVVFVHGCVDARSAADARGCFSVELGLV